MEEAYQNLKDETLDLVDDVFIFLHKKSVGMDGISLREYEIMSEKLKKISKYIKEN